MRPENDMKDFANHTAASALSPGNAELLYRLQISGLIPSSGTSPAPDDRGREREVSRNRVGIWESKAGEEGVFIRAPDTMAQWPQWANVGRIGPKGAKRRVVLIGESVARGWFYQPHYTPAGVLQSLLASVLGAPAAEVIDLARTDLGMEVRELALEAAALHPDAIVIFSGNNWRPRPSSPEQVRDCEAALESGGVPALHAALELQLQSEATRVIADVCEYYTRAQIPLIWVVPEFNLADWRDWRVNATYLGGQMSREWLECAESACVALQDGQYSQACSFGRRMVELDTGAACLGLQVLADCARREGDVARARELLRRACDAAMWDWSHAYSPRPFSVTQNAIREAAGLGCAVVDLPAIFNEHSGGALPGARLFTDYCHLTSEGIRIAMAAVASRVLEAVRGPSRTRETLLRDAPLPDAKVDAEAAFLAAIHNAHWWQPADIVKHHCVTALAFSSHVAQIMSAFAEVQASAAPMLLSAAAERLATLSEQSRHYILRTNSQQLDGLLLECIGEALAERGIDIRQRIAHALKSTHSVAHTPCDLLSFYFQAAGGLPQELAWVRPSEVDSPRVDYFRAYGLESHFAFVCEASLPVELSLTLRVPAANESQSSIQVSINGVRTATLKARPTWTTHSVKVTPGTVMAGINRVVLRWPLPPDSSFVTRKNAFREYLCGRSDALFAIFGEVHTLSARRDEGQSIRR